MQHHQALTQYAHDTLRQVHMDWQRGLAEIQWEIRTPLSPEDNETRIRKLKKMHLISTLLMLPLVVYFANDLEMDLLLQIYGALVIAEYTLLFPWMYRQIRQQTYTTTTIALSQNKQQIRITHNGNVSQHKFHQNAALPAFWLPQNGSGDLYRLRNDLQRQIAMKIGVHFE